MVSLDGITRRCQLLQARSMSMIVRYLAVTSRLKFQRLMAGSSPGIASIRRRRTAEYGVNLSLKTRGEGSKGIAEAKQGSITVIQALIHRYYHL